MAPSRTASAALAAARASSVKGEPVASIEAYAKKRKPLLALYVTRERYSSLQRQQQGRKKEKIDLRLPGDALVG
jgi:hypothetical protein